MSLSDLVIETRAIQVGQGSFNVRGLCTNDITTLVRAFGSELDGVVDAFKGVTGADTDSESLENVFSDLLGSAPAILATAIALAADEPDAVAKVSTLPFPVCLEALKAIWSLTVDSAGGLKKLQDSLAEMWNGIEALTGSTGTSGSPRT